MKYALVCNYYNFENSSGGRYRLAWNSSKHLEHKHEIAKCALYNEKKMPNPLVILWFPCFKKVNIRWAVWRLSSAVSMMEGKDQKQNQILIYLFSLIFSPSDFSSTTPVVQVLHYTNEKAWAFIM